jgi:hypothetical protein
MAPKSPIARQEILDEQVSLGAAKLSLVTPPGSAKKVRRSRRKTEGKVDVGEDYVLLGTNSGFSLRLKSNSTTMT